VNADKKSIDTGENLYNTGESGTEKSPAGEANSNLKRAEALLNAKKVTELAERLRLVSLSVAIQSAKTRNSSIEIRKLKAELSTLTNQAVKASREVGAIIAAIGEKEPVISSVGSDYRRALQLKTDLLEIRKQAERAIRAIDEQDLRSI